MNGSTEWIAALQQRSWKHLRLSGHALDRIEWLNVRLNVEHLIVENLYQVRLKAQNIRGVIKLECTRVDITPQLFAELKKLVNEGLRELRLDVGYFHSSKEELAALRDFFEKSGVVVSLSFWDKFNTQNKGFTKRVSKTARPGPLTLSTFEIASEFALELPDDYFSDLDNLFSENATFRQINHVVQHHPYLTTLKINLLDFLEDVRSLLASLVPLVRSLRQLASLTDLSIEINAVFSEMPLLNDLFTAMVDLIHTPREQPEIPLKHLKFFVIQKRQQLQPTNMLPLFQPIFRALKENTQLESVSFYKENTALSLLEFLNAMIDVTHTNRTLVKVTEIPDQELDKHPAEAAQLRKNLARNRIFPADHLPSCLFAALVGFGRANRNHSLVDSMATAIWPYILAPFFRRSPHLVSAPWNDYKNQGHRGVIKRFLESRVVRNDIQQSGAVVAAAAAAGR